MMDFEQGTVGKAEMHRDILDARTEELTQSCVQYLCSRAPHVVGVFRTSAPLATVQKLRRRFLKGEHPNLSEVTTPHLVAWLLMYHLRELPQPLFTFKLYPLMLAAAGSTAEASEQGDNDSFVASVDDVSIDALFSLLRRLPTRSRRILDSVVQLLGRIAEASDENEMTALSLANIFAPLLGRPEGSAYLSIRHRQGLVRARLVVRALIERYGELADEFASTAEPLPEVKETNEDEDKRVESNRFLDGPSPAQAELAPPRLALRVSTQHEMSTPPRSHPDSGGYSGTFGHRPRRHEAEVVAALLRHSVDLLLGGNKPALDAWLLRRRPCEGLKGAVVGDAPMADSVPSLGVLPDQLPTLSRVASDHEQLIKSVQSDSDDDFNEVNRGAICEDTHEQDESVYSSSDGAEDQQPEESKASKSGDSPWASAAVATEIEIRPRRRKGNRQATGSRSRKRSKRRPVSASPAQTTERGRIASKPSCGGAKKNGSSSGNFGKSRRHVRPSSANARSASTVSSSRSAGQRKSRGRSHSPDVGRPGYNVARREVLASCKALKMKIEHLESTAGLALTKVENTDTNHVSESKSGQNGTACQRGVIVDSTMMAVGGGAEELRKARAEYKALKRQIRNGAASRIQRAYVNGRSKLGASGGEHVDRNHICVYERDVTRGKGEAKSESGEVDSSRNLKLAWSSPAKLAQEKRALKKRLKKYDVDFEQRHGRRPTRKEKEPIRHLYEAYNTVKALMSDSHSGAGASLGGATLEISNGNEPTVEALVREKRALQSKLRLFEREFGERHGRKVKYPSDIRGLEDEYRRYKELKAALATHKKQVA